MLLLSLPESIPFPISISIRDPAIAGRKLETVNGKHSAPLAKSKDAAISEDADIVSLFASLSISFAGCEVRALSSNMWTLLPALFVVVAPVIDLEFEESFLVDNDAASLKSPWRPCSTETAITSCFVMQSSISHKFIPKPISARTLYADSFIASVEFPKPTLTNEWNISRASHIRER